MSRNKLVLLVALGTLVAALPFLVALGAAGLAVYGISRAPQHDHATTTTEPGVRYGKTYDLATGTHAESREVQREDGVWLKDGPSGKWNRSEMKLEEGSYRDGKREGQWTFWNADGSIDEGRSGIYENDVRVQAGATPPGDYPPDEVEDR